MKRGMKKGILLLALLMLTVLTLAGCKDPISGLTEGSSNEEVVQLADTNALPENGVVTAAQFRSIEGQDKVVTFNGSNMYGYQYTWTFNGKDIHNPDDQNLKVDFTTEGETLNSVKAAAGGATYGLGITLTGNKGLITVPQLTITLPEKWDADTAVFCKLNNGQPAKMSNVTFDNSAETTKLTMNIVETGGDYYIVAGKTVAPVPTASGNTGDGSTTTEGNGENESTGGNTCTISINCSTILNNMGNLSRGKEEFVPSDGWILRPTTVQYNDGESVHDVLQRVCRDNGIQMESSFTPAYNSAYVEGINQLYEFDCGELSGWMYNVNGWFPNYGCSQYTVKSGDVINWVYTCDLGKDVGDNSMW
ncbi:DUF4430 domain-containing protein [Eubacterium sp.]|uniref:DUF4430 domain-containing protein n=1 Tax=Eubacterium sp. TaxID=142586 RepID=UPI0026E0EE14|nr:DUF4430 domain-containing protein [Eubacterium sp.]MDO5433603.1 DUF4430 domain-containing protein [Eubacterium sp.]